MNILFILLSLSPSIGGVEKVSDKISTNLKKKGHSIYAIYELSSSTHAQYNDTIQLKFTAENTSFNTSAIAEFIDKHNIDIIINQRILSPNVWNCIKAIKLQNNSLRLYSFLHTTPDFYDKLHKTGFWKNIFYKFYKIFKKESIIRLITDVYRHSDKVVLLAKSFIPIFSKYYRIEDTEDKLYVINNPCIYDEYGSSVPKEKMVLIVSRLDESTKRISLALKIWAITEQQHKDWQLVIVGDGPDYTYYNKMANELNLTNIAFTGHQFNPKPFYEKASIFIMTSDYEGWGMTLVEAQQNMCIPIAFNTFESLSEIITDGSNGYTIPSGDINMYAQTLSKLMADDKGRFEMSYNAVESTMRFSIDNIIIQWESLIKS